MHRPGTGPATGSAPARAPCSQRHFTAWEAEAQAFRSRVCSPRRPRPTLLFCMSLLAPFFRSTRAASTLFTAAAQCRADLPVWEAAVRQGGAGGRGPSPTGGAAAQLTQIIHGVDIGMCVDEVFQHALHGQAGGQDQRGRAIVHAGVQVCGSVPDQNLGNSQGLSLGKVGPKALRSLSGPGKTGWPWSDRAVRAAAGDTRPESQLCCLHTSLPVTTRGPSSETTATQLPPIPATGRNDNCFAGERTKLGASSMQDCLVPAKRLWGCVSTCRKG